MLDPGTPPRLYDAGGNLAKRWYIDFVIWDTDQGKLVRRQYTGMNKHRTLGARRAAAAKKLAEIRALLAAGYTAGHTPALALGIDVQRATLAQALVFVRDRKQLRRGIEEYNRLLRRVREHAAFAALPVRYVQPGHVATFLDAVGKRRKRDGEPVGPKSFNHYRNTLRSVFGYLVRLNLLPTNPALAVACRKVAPSPLHLPYTDAQRAAVRAELVRRDDGQLLLFISFIYYCFVRSGGELRLLRVRDLLPETVRVPAATAKNNKAEHVAIPRQLEALIAAHGLRGYPADYFVFTHAGRPGPAPVGPNYFPLRHRKVLRLAGILDPCYTVYGYKHTGAINLYLATRDIELVRQHCRHAHAGMTATYLRGLGALHDGRRLDAMPDF